jgi:hypothetical protein
VRALARNVGHRILGTADLNRAQDDQEADAEAATGGQNGVAQTNARPHCQDRGVVESDAVRERSPVEKYRRNIVKFEATPDERRIIVARLNYPLGPSISDAGAYPYLALDARIWMFTDYYSLSPGISEDVIAP